jgi:hypothetical protein
MYRKIGVSIAVLAAMALTVSIVAAGNAHFVGTPQISTSGETATVTGKIAGLGNITQIDVVVTAQAECINRGNKNPNAENKQTVGGASREPVQNGKANFEVQVSANFQPDCSPPMRLEWTLISIEVYDTFGNLLLTYP